MKKVLIAMVLAVTAVHAYAKPSPKAEAKLAKLEGKYFSDVPSLIPLFKQVLGPAKYKIFDDYNAVQIPLKRVDDVIVGQGMQAHSGADQAVCYVITADNNVGKTMIVIRKNKKIEAIYGSKRFFNYCNAAWSN